MSSAISRMREFVSWFVYAALIYSNSFGLK